MTGIPESLILLAVAGVLLRFWSGTGALRAAIRPAGLLLLALTALWRWVQLRFDLSIFPAATISVDVDAFDGMIRWQAVWIACGLGASLLLVDSGRKPNDVGLVLLAVAGLGTIAAGDSAIWLIVGLYVVALATAVQIRSGNNRERLVFQAVCLALFLFGVGLLTAQTGTLSLSEMRIHLRWDAVQGESAAPTGSGLAIAAAVLIMAGLSGFMGSFWLPWGATQTMDETRMGHVAAAVVLPVTTAVLLLLRLVPGLLSAWNPEVVTILMITAVLLAAAGLLAAWLQIGLREMLGWACVAHAGLWCASLTVAAWDANHPDWNLVTKSGLPGGYTATLIALFCDVAALLGVWASLSLLAGERGTLQHPDELCGLLRQQPLAGAALSLCLLSLCGAPFLAGFWGRFWTLAAMFGPRQASSLTGLYEPHHGFLALAAVAGASQLLLCALYLRLLQRIVLEHPLGRIRPEGGASARMAALVLTGVVLAVGLRPGPLMRAMTPRVISERTAPETPPPARRDDEGPSAPGGAGGQQALRVERDSFVRRGRQLNRRTEKARRKSGRLGRRRTWLLDSTRDPSPARGTE